MRLKETRVCEDLAVERTVMDRVRYGQILGMHSGQRGVCDLGGAARGQIVNPEIARLVGALMRDRQAVAGGREGRWIARGTGQPSGEIRGLGAAGAALADVGPGAAVFVADIGEPSTLGSKVTRPCIPLRICYPGQLAGGDIQQGDVEITAVFGSK